MMTKQEIFDTVAKHIFEQGRQASDPNTGKCFYRMPDGSRCAVGALIPDALYSPDMENKKASVVMDRYPQIRSILGEDNDALLNELQARHDVDGYWQTTATMRTALRDTALYYYLDPAILDTLSFSDR